jgi:hypothetical protein
MRETRCLPALRVGNKSGQNEAMETSTNDDQLTPDEMAEFERMNTAFTPAHYRLLESELYIHAAVRGWTGDPFQQPARVVFDIARRVFQHPAP